MRIKKIKISELPQTTTLEGLKSVGVDAQNQSVSVDLTFVQTTADRAEAAIQQTADAIAAAQEATSDAIAAAQEATSDAQQATQQAAEATQQATSAADAANTAATNADTAREAIVAEVAGVQQQVDGLAEAVADKIDGATLGGSAVPVQDGILQFPAVSTTAAEIGAAEHSAAITNIAPGRSTFGLAVGLGAILPSGDGAFASWGDSSNCEQQNTYKADGNLYRRAIVNGVAAPFRLVFDSGNFDPNSKLSLTGGTMTGDITLSTDTGAIKDLRGRKILIGYQGPYMGIGNGSVTVLIDSIDGDVLHTANGNAYPMWDARNLPSPLQAADVPAWAKAATKPSYTAEEVLHSVAWEGTSALNCNSPRAYSMQTGDPSNTNGPISTPNLRLMTVGPSVNRCFQLANGYNDEGNIYFRGGGDSGFLAWRKLWHDGNANRADVPWYASGFFQTSDQRLKDVEKPLDCSLDDIAELLPVYYRWKDAETMGDKRHIGLVAQEVQERFPELVSEGEDGMLTLNYAELSAVAMRGIKLLKDKTDELEDRLARLEAKLAQ